jgi:hypothetical protein
MKNNSLLGILAMLCLAVSGLAQEAKVETVVEKVLFEPYGIAVDDSSTNNFYYATESGSGAGGVDSVQELNPATKALKSLTQFGGQPLSPQGITRAGTNLIVADAGRHRVLKVTPSSVVTVLAGVTGDAGAPNSGATNGSAAHFNFPAGVVWDGGDTVFVADTFNDVIRKVGLSSTNPVSTYATGFRRPTGLAYDRDGDRLFVADTGNNVIKIVENGGLTVTKISPGFGVALNGPRGLLWLGGETGLLVTDTGNHAIQRLFQVGGSWFMSTYAGVVGLPGKVDDTLDKARFNEPVGLAVDLNGAIVVADLKNNAIRRVVRAKLETPKIEPANGSFSNTVQIAVTGLSAGAVLRYTDDGNDPTSTSAVVPVSGGTNVVTINKGDPKEHKATVKVRAFSPDAAPSDIVSGSYSFFVNPLEVKLDGVVVTTAGSFTNDVAIVLSNRTTGATIRFTTNVDSPGANPDSPTAASPQFAANSVDKTQVLKLRAFRDGYDDSAEVVLDFKFATGTIVIRPPGPAGQNPEFNAPKEFQLFCGTTNAILYWNIAELSENALPGPANGVRYDGASLAIPPKVLLETNGLLQVTAYKVGYTNGPSISATFPLKVARPKVSPEGGFVTNNIVQVTVTDTTLAGIPAFVSASAADLADPALFKGSGIFYTIDGSDPTNAPVANRVFGPFKSGESFLLNTNGNLQVKAFYKGFAASDVTSTRITLQAGKPLITLNPDVSIATNSVEVKIEDLTTNSIVFFTLNGTRPGELIVPEDPRLPTRINGFSYTNDSTLATEVTGLSLINNGTVPATVLSGVTQGKGTIRFTLMTNATVTAFARLVGFDDSPTSDKAVSVKLPKLEMTPSSGFFPDGTSVEFKLSAAVPARDAASVNIYYTLDGSVPTEQSLLYTNKFKLNAVTAAGVGLQKVRARAFATNTIPSDVVDGQPVGASEIGVPQGVAGGVGSTIVVPVVVNLPTNVIRSLQYKVLLWPDAPATNLVASVDVMSSSGTDFVPAIGSVSETAGPAKFSVSGGTVIGPDGVATNVLDITFIGSDANFRVQDFATVALLAISVPTNAAVGNSFSVRVVQPSATSDGQQHRVDLSGMAARTITVSNIPYIVGDSSPGAWYNAGSFGDGELDNADVNNAFSASLGVRTPFSFSDAFDAMDAFPEDSAAGVGGDGQLRFLDWQVVLRRSLRTRTNNWSRSWSVGGVRVATAITTNLVRSASSPGQEVDSALRGHVWPDAEITAGDFGQAQPGQNVTVPIRVKVLRGRGLAGLQFRAAVQPESGAPALDRPVQFTPASSIPNPLQANGLPIDQVGHAWTPLLNPFAAALAEEVEVGTLTFMVPVNAQTGQAYSVRFLSADGAPDLETAVDLAGNAGSVVVGAPPKTTVPSVGPRGFKLNWQGQTGQHFVIESSADLVRWTVEAADVTGRGRVQEFLDQGTAHSAKFYRVRPKQ